MRYRFKGLIRSTGKPVEGHVESELPDEAMNVLSENGIVTESLREEPRALDLSREPHANPGLVNAIESALDISSVQVPFDQLANKYKGKSVWVIDRDKIRRRVAQVVDAALASGTENETADQTRERVAAAIDNLFKDNRNITSKASTAQLALDRQIERLGLFIAKAESVLASISIAGGRGGGWGGDIPRRYAFAGRPREGQNEVLLEIFKSNLELRGINVDEHSGASGAADVATSPELVPQHPPATEPAPERPLEPSLPESEQTSTESHD